jgi:hypothetical protein
MLKEKKKKLEEGKVLVHFQGRLRAALIALTLSKTEQRISTKFSVNRTLWRAP